MVEASAHSAIQTIRHRAVGISVLRRRELSLEEAMVLRLNDVFSGTAIRSDVLISLEMLKPLETQIDAIRENVFQLGSPWTEHPDYSVNLEEGMISSEDAGERFWLPDLGDGYEADADRQHLSERMQDRLWVYHITPEAQFWVSFDFDNKFSFSLSFVDPKKKERNLLGRYEVISSPLEVMTREEHAITIHYLEGLSARFF